MRDWGVADWFAWHIAAAYAAVFAGSAVLLLLGLPISPLHLPVGLGLVAAVAWAEVMGGEAEERSTLWRAQAWGVAALTGATYPASSDDAGHHVLHSGGVT